ncbi:uncharacterized protein RJT21DRAFT_113197 [Scheffersomyces amazonensis]|uniref:uncharacterized protein n=1 Tax=Scheffersomyces amazonensis TaxID=1078765 RepID=UPI00315D2182
MAQSPSSEVLKKSAESHNHSLIDTNQLESLKEPLEQRASKEGKVIVDGSEYQAITERAANPSKEHLQSKAQALGLALIGASELKELSQPLEAKATKENKILITHDDHKALVNPSIERISELASEHHKVVVDQSSYSELLESSKVPLEERAAKDNKILMDVEEVQLLRQPTIETLEAHAGQLNHVIIPKDTLKELNSKAEESLEVRAEQAGVKLLSDKQYDELLIKANKPSLEEIKQRAKSADHVVVPLEEYNELQVSLEERARQQGKVVVEESEFQHLKDIETIQQRYENSEEFTFADAEDSFVLDYMINWYVMKV